MHELELKDKFICDAMLGRLARYLRFLGFDTLYFNNIEDSELIKIAQEEQRIIITRDMLLIKRKWVRENSILVKSDNYIAQLREVNKFFPLAKKLHFFTRCSICNTPLVDIDREKVKHRVPLYVYNTQKNFKYCPLCDKIYWSASHIERLKKILKTAGIIQ